MIFARPAFGLGTPSRPYVTGGLGTGTQVPAVPVPPPRGVIVEEELDLFVPYPLEKVSAVKLSEGRKAPLSRPAFVRLVSVSKSPLDRSTGSPLDQGSGPPVDRKC